MSRRTAAIGLLGSIGFLSLSIIYRGFVLDDAYIIYRYSDHLVRGHGLVWNIGEDPVEGYTSFLWVLLSAFGMLFRIDPVSFSKAVSTLSGLAVIWFLAWSTRHLAWWLSAILTWAIAFNPSFAMLSQQGLETTLTSLLMLGMAMLTLVIVETRSLKAALGWHALGLLGALSRPDTAPISVGLAIGIVILLVMNRDRAGLRTWLVAGLPFVLLGVTYMVWRFWYFGYFFPNTYYIKQDLGHNVIKWDGVNYLRGFVKEMILPYPFLALLAWKRRSDARALTRIAPQLLAMGLFGFYLTTIFPIQGHLWRYAFPILPIVFWSLGSFLSSIMGGVRHGRSFWTSFGLVGAYLFWATHTLPLTLYERDYKSPVDRVLIGKRLAGLPGTMLVTESGALPFYSGWRAVDVLGLNSEELAHQGISPGFLVALTPDLVMLLQQRGRFNFEREFQRAVTGQVVTRYLASRGFVAVAAIHKGYGQYHFYFLRRASPLFDEILPRLRGAPGVEYGDLKTLLTPERGIPLYSEAPYREALSAGGAAATMPVSQPHP